MRAVARLKPPPKLDGQEWAEKYRRLSSESAAEPGPWRSTPFQRGMLEACTDPLVREVWIMSGAQVGKTETILNVLGYYIDQEPSPILLIQPTLEMGQAFSKDRLSPMLRDTPALRGLVAEAKSRDSGNTILHKRFPGGHLTIAGANSPASLSSRPIRIVMFDEIDRYPVSAGTEGDPISLGMKRTARFPNRKAIGCSTPTIEEQSRIEELYKASDMRKFFVPCGECGEFQVLEWGAPDSDHGVKWEKGDPDSARYACSWCSAEWRDVERWRAIKSGEWRSTADGRQGVAGFHVWEAYWPTSKLSDMVASFLEAKRLPETLQTWINTTLGETWRPERGEIMDMYPLLARREDYPASPVPNGVLVLTGAVDVQKDRLELEVVGWGEGEECWSIEHVVIHGDVTRPQVWAAFATQRARIYDHAGGHRLQCTRWAVDSSAFTEHVYRACSKLWNQGVMMVKGVPGPSRPTISVSSGKHRAGKVRLYLVGVDGVKDSLAARLAISDPGPGHCHHPKRYEEQYFRQLCSEVRTDKGWRKRSAGAKNEALDLRVYNIAALASMGLNLAARGGAASSGGVTMAAGARARRRGVRRSSRRR